MLDTFRLHYVSYLDRRNVYIYGLRTESSEKQFTSNVMYCHDN